MLELHAQHSVVQRLWYKHDRRPGHERIKPLLLVTSGGMRGVYGGGAVLALRELGLFDSFDTVVGISTGAAIAAYSIAGETQAQIGSTVYLEECTGRGFVGHPFILPTRITNIVDVDFIEFVFSLGWKRIDVEAIKRSHQTFYVGAMNVDTGRTDLIDAKTAKPFLLRALKASMGIVGSVRSPVEVNGNRYLDGWLDPLPIQQVIERFQPTDIVIIPNCTPQEFRKRQKIGLTQVVLAALATRYRLRKICRACLLQPTKLRQSVAWLEGNSLVPYGILWSPNVGVHQTTSDPTRLRAAMGASRTTTLKVFGREH